MTKLIQNSTPINHINGWKVGFKNAKKSKRCEFYLDKKNLQVCDKRGGKAGAYVASYLDNVIPKCLGDGLTFGIDV